MYSIRVKWKKIDYLPAAVEDQIKVKPIYKSFKGWKTSTKGIKKFDELPENAKIYIQELEKFIETKYQVYQQVQNEMILY